jgi:glutamate-1-semialdehyde 2,1-aminomutase
MNRNQYYHEKLTKFIPGGAHTYSKGDDQWPEIAPKCIEKGKGCYVWDADGNQFIDWSMGLTSVAFGHANEEINYAAIQAMSLGHNFQRPSTLEALAAEKLLTFLGDRGEMVKFAKNGSTVTTAAVKLSRAFTGRDKVAICSEHPFFSYDDWFIGSTKCAAGIPNLIKELTVKFSYNNIESVKKMFIENENSIACIIIEPVKFDPPENNFLNKLFEECKKNGAILIFDEMVTGFKWHKQGAGKYYEANADLYTWGKGMANGHSVCALTGKREIMELGGILHDKPRVFLSSTTHGAEIPQLAALIKTLEIIESDSSIFQRNWEKGKQLKNTLKELCHRHSLSDSIDFTGEDCFFVVNLLNTGKQKANIAKTFLLQELIKQSQLFQGLFYITSAHNDEAIKKTIQAWNIALPNYKSFILNEGNEKLIGSPIKPVFREYNNCECLPNEICRSCSEKI